MLFVEKFGFELSSTRFAFNALETKQTKGTWNTILLYSFNRVKEVQSTQKAQRAGHIVSYQIFKQLQFNKKMEKATNPWLIGFKY